MPTAESQASRCAVCDARASQMSKVFIEGRTLVLCAAHAATVVAARPETFEDMRALFVGAAADVDTLMKRDGAAERRSPVDRRVDDDRRTFPPRPEGRRRAGGRRTSDPREL